MSVNAQTPSGTPEISSAHRNLIEQRVQRAREAKAQGGEAASSIPRRPAGIELPLSSAQERLWFLHEVEPASPVYNLCQGWRITGPLDGGILEKALNEIVRRHEVLRTNFNSIDGRAVQVVAGERRLKLNMVDLTSSADAAAELERWLREEPRRPFDLREDILLRATFVRVSATECVLILTMHHIVSDGWSIGVMFRELAQLYAAFRASQPSPLPELPVQFADFAYWERDRARGPALQKSLEYWKKQLGGTIPALALPLDHPKAQASASGGVQAVTLSLGVSNGLKKLAQEENATLFIVLLAAFQTLLHRVCAQDDIVVGSVVAGRRKVALEKLIGFFVQTLVLRSDLSGEPNVRALIGRVRETVFGAMAHDDLPFEHLVRELRPDRTVSRNPLFQVMFILQNAPMAPTAIADLGFESLELDTGTAKFDLTLSMMETPQGLRAAFEYNADLFEAATVAGLLASFEALTADMVAHPERSLSELQLMSEAERQRVLTTWNQTAMDYPRDATIPELFEAQVKRTPNAVAIVGRGERLTYAELDARANQIAARLRAAGVGPESMVGVFLGRTPQLVVAILGVLKAGGGYVPLDPVYPAKRIGYIVNDTKMKALVTERALFDTRPAGDMTVVVADDETSAVTAVARPAEKLTADSLAYVIFTSGSTGQPKGVQITHRCVSALIAWARNVFTTEELGGLFFSTSASFDVSVFEIFCPLCLGGKIIVGENILEIGTHPARNEVTFLSGVPSAMTEVVRANLIPASVTTVTLAGELLPQSLVESLYGLPHMKRVFDHYGPTETTVYSTGGLRKAGGVPSLGFPLSNERAYVLDRHLQPVPVGVAGELYIGGEKLARGYLNQPELSAQKFRTAPFLAGERIYKTGDGVRFRADGSLEMIGRLDHQVKVRGFRVELGEVESVLRQIPEVAEATVIARPDASGNNRLLAYVIGRDGVTLETDAMRDRLAQQLPEYMVPSAITTLEKFPLMANGKLDRSALPEPDFSRRTEASTAPRTLTEELLVEMWCDVLGLKQLGVHDNFFDVGGHSLLAAQVLARMQAGFGTEISLRQFFSAPTVARLAGIVDDALIAEIKAGPNASAIADAGEPMLA